MPLTPEQIAEVNYRRKYKVNWHRISLEMSIGYHQLRYECDPEYRRKHEQRLADQRQSSGIHDSEAGFRIVPPDVIADRDRRRALEPRSITAALFGDPLPGMSALDKRRPHLVHSRAS